MFKSRQEALVDIIRWLDRSLINLAKQFGDFEKGLRLFPTMCLEHGNETYVLFSLYRCPSILPSWSQLWALPSVYVPFEEKLSSAEL